MQYPGINEPSVSYGITKYLDNLSFTYNCSTTFGSSGSPILNLANNKVIGIHIGSSRTHDYNIGIFLINPIIDFIKKIYSNKFEENEIKSLINNSANKVHIEYNVKNKDNNYNENENSLSDIIIIESSSMISHNFKNIKILNLTYNNISDVDIDILKVDFENLEKLYLNNNKISDINILEKVKFAKLKELYLNSNNISNIDILEKVNFPNLERLDLSCNKIFNIDVFEKVNFTKLKVLSFHKNKLTNIDKIKLANLENLETLALSFNERIDITPLKDVKFKNLNYLFLDDINLKSIDILCSYSFKQLKILPLGGNNISNIKALSKVDFKELESLFLFDNNISDIEVLAEVNFPQLKYLNLASNKITNIEVLKKVNFPELNELDLQQNEIVNIDVFKNCRFKKLMKLNTGNVPSALEATSPAAPFQSPAIARWAPNTKPAPTLKTGIFFNRDFPTALAAVLPAVLAAAFLNKERGATVIHDPRLYWNTLEIVKSAGGTAVESKTGHAFIKERMRKEKAVYGGEMSAHHYFKNFAYCDSGMLPWLMICELICTENRSLSDFIRDAENRYPISGEINLKVKDTETAIANVLDYYKSQTLNTSYVDGVSLEFENWRFNLRASNTEPLLRLNVEAKGDRSLVENKTSEIVTLIEKTDLKTGI